ncbi:MAG: GAF domain-containing protein [Nitrospirae bacterium]|nr:GAF domain-containing protein [Nitrospirota bacterium]
MTIELETPEEVPTPEEVQISEGLVFDQGVTQLGKRLEIVGKLVSLLSLRGEFSVLINKIMDLCMEAVDCEAGSILEVDEKKGDLFFVAARGPAADQVMKFRVPMGKGIAGYSAETSETLAVSDVFKDPRFFKEISEALKFETRSILCMPINIRGKVYGVVEWINKKGNDVFTADDLEILKEISHGAASLIENFRLMQKYERRLKSLVSIIESVPSVYNAKSLYECSRSILKSALQLTQTDSSFLLLTDGAKHMLYSHTTQGFGDPVIVKEEGSAFFESIKGQKPILKQKADGVDDWKLPPEVKASAQMQSLFCVPIWYGQVLLGSLGIGSNGIQPVGSEEQKVLMALGIGASGSIGRFLKRETPPQPS